MDFDRIRDLIEKLTALMDARKLDELEVEVDDFKVALRRGRGGESAPVMVSAPLPAAAHAAPQEPAAPPAAHEGLHVVKSPMVGILYRSPSPEADPFVEVGDEVRPDTVLCIIEAMKVMNELKAEVEGVVQSIEAENGRTVEYGQALFVIAPKGHDGPPTA